jgi:hypothetical protein
MKKMVCEMCGGNDLLNVPNDDTLAAIEDVNMGRNMSKQFHSVKELKEDLDADN